MAKARTAFRRLALGSAGRVTLVLWGVACLAIGVVLMAGHWVPLPTPDRADPVLNQSLAELDPVNGARWSMYHVLYAKCRCSLRTFDYLFARGAAPDVNETIVLVGEHDEYQKRARAHGFAVETITRETLKTRFNVETAPLLLIRDPAGAIRYSGGYTARKQGLDYQDRLVLAELRDGTEAGTLPAYGCGVSAELQAYLDPIGVKYGGDDE